MSVIDSTDNEVIENNRRLFARYTSVFKGRNPQEFTVYARRFAQWLGNEKAYYPDARQEIVHLLFIAQANLRHILGLPDEMAKPFHVDQFPNNRMVTAYADMVRAIVPFATFFVEPSLKAHLITLFESLSPGPGSSSTPMSSNYMVQSDHLQRPNPQPYIPQGNGNVHHQSSMSATPEHQSQLPPNDSALFASPTPISHTIPYRPLVASPPQSSGSTPSNGSITSLPPNSQMTTASANTQPVQKKIIKKRKTIDMTKFYNVDVQSYLEKQKAGQAVTSLPLPSDTSSETPHADAIKASPQPAAALSSPSTTPKVEETPKSVISSPVPEASVLHDLQSLANLSDRDMTVDHKKEQDRDKHMTPLDDIANQIHAPILPGHPMEPPDSLGMDVDAKSDIVPVGRARTPRHEQLDSEMTSTENGAHANNMQVDQSALITDHSPAPYPLINQVLAKCVTDHSVFNIPLQFDVTPDIYDIVTRWKYCTNSSIDLATTACITLGCYPMQDISESWTDNELSERLSSQSSWWSTAGGLSLHLGDTGAEKIPLSPPIEVTPNNSVDISDFISSGVNTARLISTTQLPNVLFVVRLHSPTPEQREVINERRKKDDDWRAFLGDITKPFTFAFD